MPLRTPHEYPRHENRTGYNPDGDRDN